MLVVKTTLLKILIFRMQVHLFNLIFKALFSLVLCTNYAKMFFNHGWLLYFMEYCFWHLDGIC